MTFSLEGYIKNDQNEERRKLRQESLSGGFSLAVKNPQGGLDTYSQNKITPEILSEARRNEDIPTDEKYAQIVFAMYKYERKVTEAKQKEIERLENLLAEAGIDPMTSLYKRDLLEPQIEEWFKELSMEDKRDPKLAGFAFVILDIDNFKQFNDIYGHITGDKVLAVLGSRIKTSLKRETDKAYRYGGDEFVLMIPFYSSNISDEAIEEVFNRLKKEINHKLAIETIIDKTPEKPKSPVPVAITAAMGYTVIRRGDKTKTVEELIDIADKNQAKEKIPEVKKARMEKAQADLA